MKLTIQLHLMSKLRMRGAIPALHLTVCTWTKVSIQTESSDLKFVCKKVNFALEQVLKARRGSRKIGLLFL